MPILLIHHHHINSHQNHEQIKQSINYKYILRMEVKVSELTATAMSIVLYMSNHNNKLHKQQIIISLRRGRSSDPRRNSGPQGLAIAIDVDSTRGGGAFLCIPVQLPYCALGIIRKSYLGVPCPNISGDQFLFITCLMSCL